MTKHIAVIGSLVLGLGWGVPANANQGELPNSPEADAGAYAWHPVPRHDAARLTLGGRFGEEAEFLADSLMPVWRGRDATLFLNLRGTFVEGREQQGSGGLVLRRLAPRRDLIAGVNTFLDVRRTRDSNTFSQGGGGLELLGPHLDLRANYYHPFTSAKILRECTTTRTWDDGNDRITVTTVRRRYEEALDGWDVEAGWWLPVVSRRVPTALYAGYARFSAEHGDDIKGVTARLEARVHPNLTLDAHWFEDDGMNRSDWFAGFRLHVTPGIRPGRKAHPRPFEDRMREMVQRDFRVRTARSGPVTVSESSETVDISQPLFQPPPPNCYLNSEGEVICD